MYILVTCIFLHYGNYAQVKNTVLSISGDVDICIREVFCLVCNCNVIHFFFRC